MQWKDSVLTTSKLVRCDVFSPLDIVVATNKFFPFTTKTNGQWKWHFAITKALEIIDRFR